MENQSTTASSSSSSQMQFLLLEQVEFLNVKDESLLQWELVNVVDSEEQQEEEVKEEEDDDSVEEEGSWDSPIFSPKETPIEGITGFLHHLHHHDHVHGHHDYDDDDDDVADVEVKDHHHQEDEDEVVDDDDDDDDGHDDGLDDELVPWNVSDKLGRQRMRKLGKRAFPRMHNSKRSHILFVTPGCVRGKHGLGLKHNY